ncbi:MAG: hypothetical protein KGI04_00530 [Candidatus Micrarchaeota archaeon]|nr:hypothetical protein [Candidatus Micrarchaeota archaeon]
MGAGRLAFNKVVFLGVSESSLSRENWAKLDALVSKRVMLKPGDPQLKSELADADCIVNGFGVQVDKQLIDAAPKLKYIGVFATAFNFVDTEYAKSKGITVCNVAGYSTEAVAEFVFGTLLEYLRDLEGSKKLGREGVNDYNGVFGGELKGKVFGIFGLGSIGSRVAEIALGFGADVRYWSRNRKPAFEAKGVRYEPIDSLIPKCDVLTFHFSHNPETKNFMSRERMQKVKKGAILVKMISIEAFDVAALEERLSKGDVAFIFEYEEETPKEVFQRLSKYKTCMIYPSNAYATNESMERRQTILISNIKNYLDGHPINKVN